MGPEKASRLILLQISIRCMILESMVRLIRFLLAVLTSSLRTRLSLQLEIAALRHQLSLYQSKGRHTNRRGDDHAFHRLIGCSGPSWRSCGQVGEKRYSSSSRERSLSGREGGFASTGMRDDISRPTCEGSRFHRLPYRTDSDVTSLTNGISSDFYRLIWIITIRGEPIGHWTGMRRTVGRCDQPNRTM